MTDEIRRALAGKYLTFALAAEEYGIPVLQVREIIKLMDITSVPQVPRHVKGVINLRGRVIPVIDLRLRIGFPEIAYSDRTSIVIAHVQAGTHATAMGLIVDAVSEVLNVQAEEIDDTPTFGDRVRTEHLSGVAKVKGTVKLLLDLDQVFGAAAPETTAA